MNAWIPRASQRKRVLWDARLRENDRTLECAACDISTGGVKVRIRERLTVPSKVVLTIDRLGSFPGEIRWQNDNYAGIRFLETAPSDGPSPASPRPAGLLITRTV